MESDRYVLIMCIAVAMVFSAAPARGDLGYTSFDSNSSVYLLGDAGIVDGRLRVTSGSWEASGAWAMDKQTIAGGLVTKFQIHINAQAGAPDGYGGTGDPGGDGMAFVIQNAGSSALGGLGHRLGYGRMPNCLAVEFDTWWNPDMPDPDDSHISIQTAGTSANAPEHAYSLGAVSAPLTDGLVHEVKIVYLPGELSIYFDDMNTPLLEAQIDLATTLDLDGGKAWLGFTAGSGTAYENHDVLNWNFMEIPEPLTALLFIPGFFLLRRRKN